MFFLCGESNFRGSLNGKMSVLVDMKLESEVYVIIFGLQCMLASMRVGVMS